MMYKRLMSFLNKHKILYKYQFGFRKNHSTSMALIEIIGNMYNYGRFFEVDKRPSLPQSYINKALDS